MNQEVSHDLNLLVLDSILLVSFLQILGQYSDSLFQYLVVESHLFFVWTRRSCSWFAFWIGDIGLGSYNNGPILILSSTIATPIILIAELHHVLTHQNLSLLDISSFRVDPCDQLLGHVPNKLTASAMLPSWLTGWSLGRCRIVLNTFWLVVEVQRQPLKRLQKPLIVFRLVKECERGQVTCRHSICALVHANAHYLKRVEVCWGNWVASKRAKSWMYLLFLHKSSFGVLDLASKFDFLTYRDY